MANSKCNCFNWSVTCNIDSAKSQTLIIKTVVHVHIPRRDVLHLLLVFLVTVKAAPHECVIRTGLP